MERFKVIGMGPGGADYVLPVAWKAIEGASIIAGAQRLLDLASSIIKKDGKETFVYQSNLQNLMDYVKEKRQENLAILVSGDPGFHSLLGAVSRNFDPDEYEVIPGLSCFQLAMARLGYSWQADCLLSCHGRKFEEIGQTIVDNLAAGRRTILLTDYKRTPQAIAQKIMDTGISNRPVWLGENLGLSDERITRTELYHLVDMQFTGQLCVMVVDKDDL